MQAGIFIDPKKLLDSLHLRHSDEETNRYAILANNPLNQIDILGLVSCDCSAEAASLDIRLAALAVSVATVARLCASKTVLTFPGALGCGTVTAALGIVTASVALATRALNNCLDDLDPTHASCCGL